MPYVPGGGAQKDSGLDAVGDVYHSSNVFVNHIEVAIWNPPGEPEREALAALSSPELTFQQEQLDGDGIDDVSTSSFFSSKIETNNQAGISSGVLTSGSQTPTSSGPVDGTAANTSTGVIITTNWDQFNKDNIPYDTLMLTPRTSLATFTKKATLWPNQPAPAGPDARQPGKGDNKYIKDQDIFVRGKKVGSITVPQILHNLSNLAANVWEPFKAKYPSAVVTNTFRQNPPGGAGEQAQHGIGMAMDIQILGATPQVYYEAACWIRDNLPFDQLLQEKSGSSRWIHVSHFSGYGYKVPNVSKVANCIVSPQYSFVPGLSVMS